MRRSTPEERPRAGEAERTLADARREIARDVGLMVEERVIEQAESIAVLGRIEERIGLQALAGCGFVQEALPESVPLEQTTFARLKGLVDDSAIIASGSSTISPSDVCDAVEGPERFLVAHWLNPAHIIPLVDVVPGPRTAPETVTRTLALLESLGKTPVRCGDSPGFIGPRLQVLLMNEAVRLVEEGVATPEDVDRAFRAGMGFRYASIGIFEFIDWGGVDILYRRQPLHDRGPRRRALQARADGRGEDGAQRAGPKTGRGFFDYTGDRREAFETEKVRALLRRLRLERQ